MTTRIMTGLLLAAVWAAAGTLPARANPNFGDAWNWPIPPRLYGTLSQDDRNQISRAEKLLREGQHDAAAVEFEKFLAQQNRSPVRPHVLLLQGYSLHLARKRNTAIARYTELLDFYAESVDQAVPALFLTGWAHRQNGNTDLAIQAWEALVANQAYRQHPLTDRALMELATHYAERNEPRKAERHLDLVINLFVEAFVRPEQSALQAHARLTRLYIEEGRYPALQALLEQAVPYVKAGDQKARIDYAYGHAAAVLSRIEDRRKTQFFNWFREQRSVYESARGIEDFFDKATQLSLRIGAQDDWRRFAEQMLTYAGAQRDDALVSISRLIARRFSEAQRAGWNLRSEWAPFIDLVSTRGATLATGSQVRLYTGTLENLRRQELEDGTPPAVFWDTLIARLADIFAGMLNPERDAGLAGLVDRLIGAERYAHAHRLADRIEHAPFALLKRVAIHMAAEEFAKAAEVCEAVEAADTGRYAEQALNIRAELYAGKLRRYEEAIVLYRAINDPPRTVWAIIECYERMGKLQEAVAVCDELENFFPVEAPRAAYRKAMIWHRANDRERAIAAFRAVLRRYPKDRVAAEAHQMQERYGFDFGGGVVEDMD